MGILDKKLAFVFPGQGSQAVGMGKALAEGCAPAARLFETAGSELTSLCFEGPAEELSVTLNTQPALYLVSCAAFEAVRQKAAPIVCAGHSAGEYAALYAAGAIGFEEGLEIIRRRAAFMDRCARENPGAMAAVIGLAADRIEEINRSVAGVCVSANFNSPVQTVVSGDKEAVAEASALYREAGARRVVPLNVSGAFHSPLMAPAAERLSPVLDRAEFSPCSVPVVANYDALPETDPETVKDNLKKQLTGSVRWVECVRKMADMGAEAFVELGSGTVLAGLIRKILPEHPVVSIGSPAELDKLDS